MLRIEHAYWLCGAVLAVCAWLNLRSRRWWFAAFWAILAASFFGGEVVETMAKAGNTLPAQVAGVGVIVLALIAGSGKLNSRKSDSGKPDQRTSAAASTSEPSSGAVSRGNILFLPALAIPVGTLVLVLLTPWLQFAGAPLFDPHQSTLTALAVACVVALLLALAITRAPAATAAREGSRLLDTLSWAVSLPMLLATLGTVFAATGIGDTVAHLVGIAIPVESRVACLLAYILGMVLFTAIMGNAFAAFPVLTAGVGLPLLISQHHAAPAMLGAVGMLSGYCGTLLTPMAANFNVVPVALLELRDPYSVIRAQWPTALVLLAFNTLLLLALVFR